MRRQELPRGLRSAPFTVSEALDRGVPRERLRARDLRAPHHGVRSSGRAPEGIGLRCAEFAPLLAPCHFFSHATAALLWGLPVPLELERPDSPLHVLTTGRHRAPRRPGIVGHASPGLPGTVVDGVPVVHPLRAWMQCAETFGVDDLVAMGDALLSRWSGVAESSFRPREELVRAVRRAAGRRGAANLAVAERLCRPNVWSPMESKLRLFIVRAGRREPDELNREQRTPEGAWLGVPDMAYPAEKRAVEYEGKEFHDARSGQFESDIGKGERFADAGWRTVRVTSDQFKRPAQLRRRVVRWLPAAGDS